jgi:hypothetical protein
MPRQKYNFQGIKSDVSSLLMSIIPSDKKRSSIGTFLVSMLFKITAKDK